MKSDTVKRKNRLYKIVKTYGFYKCCTMVIYLCFPTFCNMLTK